MFLWLGLEHEHKHGSGWEICRGICSLNNTRENRLASRPALNSTSNGLTESSNLGFHYWPFSCYLSHLFPLLPSAFLLQGYLFFSPRSFYFHFFLKPASRFYFFFSPPLASSIIFISNLRFPQNQKELYLNAHIYGVFLHFHCAPRARSFCFAVLFPWKYRACPSKPRRLPRPVETFIK